MAGSSSRRAGTEKRGMKINKKRITVASVRFPLGFPSASSSSSSSSCVYIKSTMGNAPLRVSRCGTMGRVS